jgi:hypothetical protein
MGLPGRDADNISDGQLAPDATLDRTISAPYEISNVHDGLTNVFGSNKS